MAFSRKEQRKRRTETGEVSELGGVVGHGAHEPVRGRLPRSIEDTAEDVQPDVADVDVVLEVDPWERAIGERLAGVVPAGITGKYRFRRRARGQDSLLVEVRPDVDDEDQDEEREPASVGTDAPADAALIEEETHEDGTDHLGEPVDEIVQRPGTDVEDRAVVVVEFCVRRFSETATREREKY